MKVTASYVVEMSDVSEIGSRFLLNHTWCVGVSFLHDITESCAERTQSLSELFCRVHLKFFLLLLLLMLMSFFCHFFLLFDCVYKKWRWGHRLAVALTGKENAGAATQTQSAAAIHTSRTTNRRENNKRGNKEKTEKETKQKKNPKTKIIQRNEKKNEQKNQIKNQNELNRRDTICP